MHSVIEDRLNELLEPHPRLGNEGVSVVGEQKLLETKDELMRIGLQGPILMIPQKNGVFVKFTLSGTFEGFDLFIQSVSPIDLRTRLARWNS